ncbi:hypothetical protein [Cellulomonas hominis]|uniref:hypothetical protein n=1 Tax=Cellulomonas hominis TaxID=156981 RepID=UPI001443B1E4|nr:hypothetical protein [Cellulomonas hominis]NKY11542.1 hypothetical protein [Cellulomonas hominis]
MTRPTAARLALASVSCVALLLAGCSGGGGGDGDKKSSAFEWEPGPLDAYQARIYGYSLDAEEQSQEELQAQSDEQNRRVEELVAACMQEQGFDYIPNDQNSGQVFTGNELDVDWGTVEFAEKYGYGISTDPWGNEDIEPTEWVDPNQEYVESMSESEQLAYQEALWGPTQEYVEGEEPQEYDWTQSGCYGAAQHEVYEGGLEADDFGSLQDELSTFYETVQADPRMAELNAKWASCMADAGFDGVTDMNESTQPLYDEWSAMQGWEDPEYQALMETWDWEAEPDGPPQPEPDADELAAFTKKEIAQAVADFGCQEKVEYSKTQMEIDHELQQEFVDAHRDDLEAWASAAEAKRDA